jgi:transcriptional regulator with XRE-family HTH domain
MDQTDLAEFLRSRREALQPEDVGIPRGTRRRTPGLRREEVAALCGMSADYYSRLERGRGPHPSEQMLTAIARGFHLTLDERDHLFLLAGHSAPPRAALGDHVNAGMMRILDRLGDTPAQVVNGIGETLAQTPLATALLGDQTRFTGPARSLFYRWFTDPHERALYPADDHEATSQIYIARLRATAAREGPRLRAAALAEQLSARSLEFERLWAAHEVDRTFAGPKTIIHPAVGTIRLYCQILIDPDQSQSLLVFTATPGTPDHDKLRLLGVLGDQQMTPAVETTQGLE